MIDFSKRTMSSFGVSIGTGLMLESLFKPTAPRYDDERVVPNEVQVSDYKYHFFNMMTLARNVCGAFETQLDHTVFLKDRGFSECLNEEVNTILQLYAGTGCEPIFFYPNFKYLESKLNAGKRRPKTAIVLANEVLYECLKNLNIKRDWLYDCKILENIIRLDSVDLKQKCLMTTSFMIDTFAKMNLHLIDSHTGILYKPEQFYTKYYKIGSRDMSIFPHSEILLYFIGDNSMSMIIDMSTRLKIYKIAVENGWSQKSTGRVIETGLKSDKTLYGYFRFIPKIYRY